MAMGADEKRVVGPAAPSRTDIPGPVVAVGMLFVGSGYVGTGNGMPGNVLLAFSVKWSRP